MSEKLCALRKIGGGMSEKVLWTNSAPTSDMDTQNITLSDSMLKYNYIKCVFRLSTTDATESSYIIGVDEFQKTALNNQLWPCANKVTNSNARTRFAQWISDISFLVTRAWSGGTSYSDTNEAIPIAFYGLK